MRISRIYCPIYKKLRKAFKYADISYIPDHKLYECSEPEDIILITGKEHSNILNIVKSSFTLKRGGVEKTYNGDYYFEFKLDNIEKIEKWLDGMIERDNSFLEIYETS
jgi:hypothetical protein